MGDQHQTFADATPKAPCPVCGAHKRCCRKRDGSIVVCYRLDTWGTQRGKLRTSDRGLGDRWVFRADGASLPTCDPLPVTTATRAPVEVLDRVYRALLDELLLAPVDAGRFEAPYPDGRGLPADEMIRRGYRTLLAGHARVARAIVDRFGPEVVAGVPGFYAKRDGARSWWSIGALGLLVPARDGAGRIVGCQVRCEDGDTRYRWLSSASHGGPGAGTPCHVPLHTGAPSVVRITEGCLKADAATLLDPERILTLGFPGVATWSRVLDPLAALGVRAVRVAFDADWRTNADVARAMRDCCLTLKRAGYAVGVEDWRGPKGIDDLFASGGFPVVTWG